ncbi:MAG: hypothetical protein PF693_19060 [Spirochaetia bacterium]|nr:hypothetical protein [Spirochaetia bacterium]
MKKLMVLILLVLVVFTAWSQQTKMPIESFMAMDMDQAGVDLSDLSVYFDGPVEFYVTGVKYKGMSYAGIVKLTEDQKLQVFVPTDNEITLSSRVGKSIDVSNLKIITPKSLNGVVTLADVVIDGYEASIDLMVDPEASAAAGTVVFKAASAPILKKPSTSSPDFAVIAAKDSEIAALNAKNTKLQAMYDKLAATPAMTTDVVTMAGARSLFVDLASLETFGTWKESANGIDMKDTGALYAKASAKVSQTQKELFYNFTVDANSAKGWIGAGAHILASGSKSSDGYGFGKSYLVWLTKDSRLQTDATFVQLYESMADGKMIQLASQIITGDINSRNDVSVYVNKTSRMIFVSVNGKEYISYRSMKNIPDGQYAALRAAGGPVSFSNLSAKSR